MNRELTARVLTGTSAGVWLVVLASPLGWLFALGVGLVVLVSGAWTWWEWYYHSRFATHYREFAELHGWEYTERTQAYTGRFEGYPFGFGVDRHQVDVVSGTLNGAACATFAHRFMDAVNDYRHRTFQVTVVEIPVDLPRVDIVPENTASRVLTQLGGFDISTESYEFNRRWRVLSEHRSYALSLLDPRMIERLTWADTDGMAIRIDGGAVLMWQTGRRDSDDLAHRLGVLTGIARRIPHHVVRDYIEQGHSRERDQAPAEGPPDWATQPHGLTQRKYTGIESTLARRPETTTRGALLGALDWVSDWSGRWDDL